MLLSQAWHRYLRCVCCGCFSNRGATVSPRAPRVGVFIVLIYAIGTQTRIACMYYMYHSLLLVSTSLRVY